MSEIADMFFPFKLKILQSTVASKIQNFHFIITFAVCNTYCSALNYRIFEVKFMVTERESN
jgi:hypothetical protein